MNLSVIKNNLKNTIKTITILSTLFVGSTAFADNSKMTNYMQNCDYLPTVLGQPNLYGETQKINQQLQQVCIDMPVAVKKARAVFNMDAGLKDGKGRPMGLRHMYMLGRALLGRIKMGLLDPEEVSIVGVIHGGAMGFVIDPADTISRGYIDEILKLNKAGLNISLEVCGVTMLGKGYTNSDLYHSPYGMIHVNQGAIGRIIDLQEHKYAYYQEDK